GFRYSTLYPQTISLDMVLIPPHIEKLKVDLSKEKDIGKQQEIIDEMEKRLIEYVKKDHPELYIHIASGAVKNIGQIRQIMVAKGIIADPDGNILPPISQSLNQGFDVNNYFDTSAGSRKGLIDKALNTAK